MKRRDFIKTIGISCMGSCFNPLKVFATGTTPLKSFAGYKATFPPLRLNPLRTSTAGIKSPDDMTWDPGPLLEKYDEKATPYTVHYDSCTFSEGTGHTGFLAGYGTLCF